MNENPSFGTDSTKDKIGTPPILQFAGSRVMFLTETACPVNPCSKRQPAPNPSVVPYEQSKAVGAAQRP